MRMAQFLMCMPLLSAAPAQALELTGRYGYAGEWAVSATLAEEQPAGLWRKREFTGALQLKHLAICGPGEISEKTGTIRLSRSGQRYAANLTLGGDTCNVAGVLSEDGVAFADCGKTGQIPLRLWLK